MIKSNSWPALRKSSKKPRLIGDIPYKHYTFIAIGPGQLHQSLAQASAQTWSGGPIGRTGEGADQTISVYRKGATAPMQVAGSDKTEKTFAIRQVENPTKLQEKVFEGWSRGGE